MTSIGSQAPANPGSDSTMACSSSMSTVAAPMANASSRARRTTVMSAAPCHLALDRAGRFLAVANYSGGNYSLFPVGSDGRLQPAASVVAGQPTEANPAKALGHMVGFDAGNKYLIAADNGLVATE